MDDENAPHDQEQIDIAIGLGTRLGEATSAIGLHQHGFTVGQTQSGDMVLVAEFVAGDLAWSDRVQNPEQAVVDEDVKLIDAELEFEQFRDRIQRRIDGGDDTQ